MHPFFRDGNEMAPLTLPSPRWGEGRVRGMGVVSILYYENESEKEDRNQILRRM
jgi:hypothetical protein